jgi:pilus assembly protein Flp/PilA
MIVVVVNWLAAHIRPLRNERGASLVEYALLLALIAVVCIVAIAFLGTATSSNFSGDTSSLFVSP